MSDNSNTFLVDACRHFEDSIRTLPNQINGQFDQALNLIQQTQGHVIFCGMGKSGLIGRKLSATFASTGVPSFFLHAAESVHGDLGMITPEDTLILISNSGETKEIVAILPSLKSFGNKTIAMTGKANSTLDEFADVSLSIAVNCELCPNNIAPTTSTLLTLVVGDLLAVAMMEKNNFGKADFARFHPGGSLGRRLLMRVKDDMLKPPFPKSYADMRLIDALMVMNQGRIGLTLVWQQDKFVGIITDGDLRRAIANDENALQKPCVNFITHNPVTIHENASLLAANELMLKHQINTLLAVNDEQQITGIVEIYDI